jgi:hypothetical protein
MSYDSTVQPAVESRRQQLFWTNQLLLVAAAVALCHCFQWTWLRTLTQSANLAFDSWFGVYMQPLSPTTITFQGLTYSYQVSCTFADVWCGLVPLLWFRGRSVISNVFWLMLWALGLFVFNVTRLSFSDILFAQGLPWWLAHSIFSGICYYFVWRIARPFIAAQSRSGIPGHLPPTVAANTSA